jgi:phage regulator Rha-like protein
MGNVWVRDTPFGPITDSLKLADSFGIDHKNILRAVTKCKLELNSISKFQINDQLIENSYRAGAQGRKRLARKIDITEFGLTILLLYIITPTARLISAEILYRFFFF